MKPLVYHYSKVGTYNMISPKEVFMDKDELKKERDKLINAYGMLEHDANKYLRSVSTFPFPLTKYNVLDLRKNGFQNYGKKHDKLFQYTLNLEEDRNKIESISVKSSLEEQTFMLEWDRYMKTEGDYEEKRNKYVKARSKFFALNNIPDDSPLDDYLNIYQLTEEEFRDSIEWNIKYGYKSQYASYIPHLVLLLNKGQSLTIQNVTRIL